jgi:hypothetical protein
MLAVVARYGPKITADRITFPEFGATITAMPSDYAGAAGRDPTISCFDEFWGLGHRLFPVDFVA